MLGTITFVVVSFVPITIRYLVCHNQQIQLLLPTISNTYPKSTDAVLKGLRHRPHQCIMPPHILPSVFSKGLCCLDFCCPQLACGAVCPDFVQGAVHSRAQRRGVKGVRQRARGSSSAGGGRLLVGRVVRGGGVPRRHLLTCVLSLMIVFVSHVFFFFF